MASKSWRRGGGGAGVVSREGSARPPFYYLECLLPDKPHQAPGTPMFSLLGRVQC